MKLLFENWREYLKEAEGSNIVYHGIGTTKPFNWDYNYVGTALDRFGPGFYLTNSLKEAYKYSVSRGNEGQIIKVDNRLSNPVKISYSGEPYSPGRGDVRALAELFDEQKLVALLPEEMDDSKKAAAVQYFGGEFHNAVGILKYVFRNIYKAEKNAEKSKEFFNKLMKVTGYDGIIVNFSKAVWVIAWDPNKLKILSFAGSGEVKAKIESLKSSADQPPPIPMSLRKKAARGDKEAQQAIKNHKEKIKSFRGDVERQIADAIEWRAGGA